MSKLSASSYRRIFYPESLVVVGASDNMMKFGGMFLRSILTYGYKGRIYPVNPKGGDVMGIKVWPSVESIPERADFAVITVPAPHVIPAVKECAKKGIAGAEILSAGFREAGPEGEALELELVDFIKKSGFRVIGPNCFGVYSPEVGLTLMPGDMFSTKPGPVGFFSQSGGGACDAVYMSQGRGVNFSTVVSYGNGCDIEAAELLRYFESDPDTGLVGAYIEGVREGRSFFKALKSCASKKPVVIFKGGLSEQGERGTLGHTGSMAGSRVAWEAAAKSAGAVLAKDMRDLVESLMAFNCLGEFCGKGAGILGGGGMRCVEGLDAAGEYGFSVPELDADMTARLAKLLPPVGGKAGNPMDLANPMMAPSVIIPMMEAMAEQSDIDFLVLYQMLFHLSRLEKRIQAAGGGHGFKMEYHKELAAAAGRVRERTGKPLAVVLPDITSDPDHWESELGRMESRHYYTSNNVPCFDSGLGAFGVLRRVADYYGKRCGRV